MWGWITMGLLYDIRISSGRCWSSDRPGTSHLRPLPICKTEETAEGQFVIFVKVNIEECIIASLEPGAYLTVETQI